MSTTNAVSNNNPVDMSTLLGPTSSAYSWDTTSRQTGYCSTRWTETRPSGSDQTGIQ